MMSWKKKVQLDGRGENISFLRENKKGEKKSEKEQLKEQHPGALEGTATHQVSISHLSLPVGLSVRSVAWHGGRRGGGAVRLTQGVAWPTKQAHVHPHTDTIFVLCEQV